MRKDNVAINLSSVEILPVRPHNGLLGFASFVLNEQFACFDIAIHSRPDGNLRLVFPAKRLANGKVINTFYPINKEAADHVLREVSEAYRKLTQRCENNVGKSENYDGEQF